MEENKDIQHLCSIDDLAEAANRKMGQAPDVDAEWKRFSHSRMGNVEKNENSQEKHSRFMPIFRYVAACVAIVLVVVWIFFSLKSPLEINRHQLVYGKDSVEKQVATPSARFSILERVLSSKKPIVTIKADEQKTISLPDGTEVCLNAKSTLSYPEDFGKDKREIEFCGEGYFKVHHDADRPFVIKTRSVSTKVLGTEFNLRCYDIEDVHVTLVRGSVEVASLNNKVKIAPNQDAYIENGNVLVQNVNPKDFTSWKEGILYFDNASLRTILQQLGRVYNVNVVCRDEHLLDKHFHYMCNMNDCLEEALKLLNESSDINIKLRDNAIVIE